MYEKAVDADIHRNTALSSAGAFDAATSGNAIFESKEEIRKLIESMPIFSSDVAVKMVERRIDMARTAVMSSIVPKINALENQDEGAIIAFVKTQKKDNLYDSPLAFPIFVRLFPNPLTLYSVPCFLAGNASKT